MLLNMLSTANS